MDLTKDYEDILQRIENLKYLLRIQDRQEEASLVSGAQDALKLALDASKKKKLT